MKAKRESTLRKELVREEILTKAADVFEKKGFAQTTILDVAQALELSRSSLYHYFKSKDEILEALVLEHTEHAAEQMEEKLARRIGSASERLKELLSSSINGRMTRGARIRVLDQLAAEMPPEIKQKFDQGRRRVLDLYTRLIQNGIDAGELRPVDARTAALAILGIASWTSWWYSPAGRKSPEELAELLVDIAFHGITQPQGTVNYRSTKDVLRSLKRHVSQLEKTIKEDEN